MTGLPGYPCPVCNRAGGAVTVSIQGQKLQQFCSLKCARTAMSEKPVTPNEQAALKTGGQAAGRYLEQIGQTDLRHLTKDQWTTFCTTLFQATCADMRKQADDDIPFFK